MWTVSLNVEIKLRFRDGLVWTVSLNVEIKLRFRDGLVWTVSLNVELKLRFRDGLVWTVSLNVEIKLRFQILWHIVDGALDQGYAKRCDEGLCFDFIFVQHITKRNQQCKQTAFVLFSCRIF